MIAGSRLRCGRRPMICSVHRFLPSLRRLAARGWQDGLTGSPGKFFTPKAPTSPASPTSGTMLCADTERWRISRKFHAQFSRRTYRRQGRRLTRRRTQFPDVPSLDLTRFNLQRTAFISVACRRTMVEISGAENAVSAPSWRAYAVTREPIARHPPRAQPQRRKRFMAQIAENGSWLAKVKVEARRLRTTFTPEIKGHADYDLAYQMRAPICTAGAVWRAAGAKATVLSLPGVAPAIGRAPDQSAPGERRRFWRERSRIETPYSGEASAGPRRRTDVPSAVAPVGLANAMMARAHGDGRLKRGVRAEVSGRRISPSSRWGGEDSRARTGRRSPSPQA